MIDQGLEVASGHGLTRSPHWSWVKEHTPILNGHCLACFSTTGLQLHHLYPFHLCVLSGRPDLELDARNLRYLCQTEEGKPEQDHHLLIGHSELFTSYSLFVEQDAAAWFNQSKEMIKSLTVFKQRVENRPLPYGKWTAEQKRAFRVELDEKFPVDPESQFFKFGGVLPPDPTLVA